MASQTGTLKFRQSDGTYTELYPKTTIAQVDGLQTQLDSINTSLQNKVGQTTQWNYTPQQAAKITVYGDKQYVFSHDSTEILLTQLSNLQRRVSIGYGGKNYPSIFLQYNDTADNSNNARIDINVHGIQYFQGTDSVGELLATQSYVTSQIQGAIAASY